MLVDIHSHLLPGVDDGAQMLDDSIALANLAVSEGVGHLIVTPHHFNNQYVNHKPDVLEATEELQKVYDKLGIPLRLHAAQEIRIQKDLTEKILYTNDYLSLDAKGKFYLIEMPTKTVPDFAFDVCQELIDNGITPVIAHPERNHAFAKNLRLLYPFIDIGCIGQLTSHCYIGFYGDQLRATSQEMIEHNLVHLIASDAHHMKHRPFNLAKAYDLLATEYGPKMAKYFQFNAVSTLRGESFKTLRPKNKKRFGIF